MKRSLYRHPTDAEFYGERVDALTACMAVLDAFSVSICQLRVRATTLIRVLRYGFQMCRIDAGPLTTEMVKLESGRDRSDLLFIHSSVRHHEATLDWMPRASVALLRDGLRPDPAGGRVAAIFDLVVALIEMRTAHLGRVVTADVSHRHTSNSPLKAISPRREGRSLPAAALAETGRNVLRHAPIFAH